MLHKIGIELGLPPDKKLDSRAGSIFHGLLMEIVATDDVSALHDESAVRPYSQYIYWDNDKQRYIWCISILQKFAEYRIMGYINEVIGSHLHLRKKGYDIELKQIVYDVISDYDKLADEVFLSERTAKIASIEFMTTTSFKRNGRYIIMPELYLVFQSLINKWNELSEENKLEEDGLANILANCCVIQKYRLQSKLFSVDGKNIYGFNGNISIKINGTDMSTRIITLLLKFAEFSGIGAKTALGMGAAKVIFK